MQVVEMLRAFAGSELTLSTDTAGECPSPPWYMYLHAYANIIIGPYTLTCHVRMHAMRMLRVHAMCVHTHLRLFAGVPKEALRGLPENENLIGGCRRPGAPGGAIIAGINY